MDTLSDAFAEKPLVVRFGRWFIVDTARSRSRTLLGYGMPVLRARDRKPLHLLRDYRGTGRKPNRYALVCCMPVGERICRGWMEHNEGPVQLVHSLGGGATQRDIDPLMCPACVRRAALALAGEKDRVEATLLADMAHEAAAMGQEEAASLRASQAKQTAALWTKDAAEVVPDSSAAHPHGRLLLSTFAYTEQHVRECREPARAARAASRRDLRERRRRAWRECSGSDTDEGADAGEEQTAIHEEADASDEDGTNAPAAKRARVEPRSN
jgi:hypothetical protein